MKSTSERTTNAGKALVVVTGAGKGVGYGTALALARMPGVEVIAVSRNVEAWRSGSAHEGIVALEADLSTDEGISEVLHAIGDRPLFGLVNNAGLLLKRELGTWTRDDLERLYAVNAWTPLILTQALLPALRRSSAAHVVNISSMGGFQGSVKFPGLIGYSSSKSALACITECLAEELKGTNVRSNCLCLGAVDTSMLREAFPGYQAPTDATTMGAFIADFLLNGHKLLNGKVLPISASTP